MNQSKAVLNQVNANIPVGPLLMRLRWCRRGYKGLLIPALVVSLPLLAACSDRAWNNPYPAAEQGTNTLYSSFSERPKHLDPARSYNANEYQFIAQIYEPPLQYHFLKRPYTLVPLTAVDVPTPRYIDAAGQTIEETADDADVAYSIYDVHIRPGLCQ